MDRIRPKWHKWTELDRIGMNWTELDRIGQWWTELDRSRPNKPK